MGEQRDELTAQEENEARDDGPAPGTDAPPDEAEETTARDEVAALQRELEAQRAQAAEYLEGWQRARAEFANYRRRVEKEQNEAYQSAAGRVIARFLDVLDDLDRAMKDRPSADSTGASTAEAHEKWAEGVSLIQRKLQNILDAEGVTPIDADGQPFDPSLHEAISHEESAEYPAGQVIATVRRGYRIGDRVIRPALVRVAR